MAAPTAASQKSRESHGHDPQGPGSDYRATGIVPRPAKALSRPRPLARAGVSLLSDRPGCTCPGAAPVAVSQPAAAGWTRTGPGRNRGRPHGPWPRRRLVWWMAASWWPPMPESGTLTQSPLSHLHHQAHPARPPVASPQRYETGGWPSAPEKSQVPQVTCSRELGLSASGWSGGCGLTALRFLRRQGCAPAREFGFHTDRAMRNRIG
jgi:hypothetical protein